MWRIMFVVPPLAVGLIATVVALNARNSGDAFVPAQRHLQPLGAPAVERIVSTAPAPIDPSANGQANTRCNAQGSGQLRNPWLCTLRYRSGWTLEYVVNIKGTGAYVGQRQDDPTGFIKGCCIQVPG